MNSARLLISAFALTASTLVAQQPGATLHDGSTATTTVTGPDGQRSTVTVVKFAACPVSLQAKQGSGAGLVAVRGRDAGKQEEFKPTARIHLLLGKIGGDRQVAGVTVTARGLSARGRIDRTATADSPDLRRTLSAGVSVESDGSLYADLAFAGFTSVRSIKLESIDYADGSNMDLSQHRTCTVSPDMLMLISNR
jgi:hypothetical protein